MWEWINGKTEQFEQRMFEKGNEVVTKPAAESIGGWFREVGSDVWVWFVGVLPDIAGYGVFATGAFVMISPLVSRGGMLKPLSIMAAGLIFTVCILGTN